MSRLWILTVLKISGLVLACLLVSALLLVLLLLLAPVRYTACMAIKYPGTETAENPSDVSADAQLRFTWLFHLVRGGIRWPQERTFIIHILFFRFPLTEIPGGSSSGGKESAKRRQNKSKKALRRGSMREGLRELARSLLRCGRNGSLSGVPGELSDDLCGILRPLLPVSWQITGTVGLGDPAATGNFLDAEGLLMPLLADHVWITPDFNENHVELTGRASGRFRLLNLLTAAYSLTRTVRKLQDSPGP